MTGWVRVSRSIFEHDLFAHEPMSEREAWLWLVAKAAWKDTQHRVGGVVHDVPRGALFATLRELQSAWKWGSDGRVRRFLDLLENQRMIQRSGDAGKTRITICNYSKFQDGERTDDAAMTVCTTQPRRTDDALKEEDNKITKETNTLSGPAAPDTDRAPVKPSSKEKAGYTPEFELVWSEWPKSPTESKKLAFDRFARLSKADRDACFDGAMAQTLWLEAETERRKGRDPPPRLHLSTFISERRWENLLNTEFNRYGRTPWQTTQAQR